jgi:nucleotide-binding universal stress UspA family protein
MSTDPTTGYILVGLDGSDAALQAALWAAADARRRALPLLLVSTYDIGEYALGPYIAATDDFPTQLANACQEFVDTAQQRIAEQYPTVPTSVQVLPGTPIPALIDLSANARLTVVGANGMGAFSSMLLGSVASAIVSRGQSPVCVVRSADPSGTPPSTGPVVVGIDASPAGDDAIAWAFDEASQRGAPLIALRVWSSYPTDNARITASMHGIDWRAEQEQEERLLGERMAGWREKYPDVQVRLVLRAGPVADTLTEFVGEAQLVVTGSRGHGHITGILLGSVSRALIHHAPCPVLVVRNRG